MDYKGLLQRVILLVSSPAKAWKEIAAEDRQAVFSAFAYPMMGLCGLSVFVGTLLEGGESAAPLFQRAMTSCCAVFVSLFGGYFLAAYGINRLGVRFFGQRDDLSLARQFAGYSLVVVFLLDIITGLLPAFGILSWVFRFYTLYVVWEGTRVLTGVDERRQVSFAVMATVVLLLCPVLLEYAFNKLTVILN